MRSSFKRLSASGLLAAALLVLPAPTALAAATNDPSSIPVTWSSASRTITVDGRAIRVTVAAFLVSITNSAGSRANVTVTLEALDGEALPDGLTAEHIRLQRSNLPTRIVHRDLVNIDPPAHENASFTNFGLDSGFQTATAGAKFKTSIRLNVNGRDMLVPMGTIRVNTSTLLDPGPGKQPDLTPSL